MQYCLSLQFYRFIILFFCSLGALSCHAQKHQNITLKNMQKFNIEQFKQHKKGFEWRFTQPDGSEVLQAEFQNGYVEKIQPKNSPYTYIKDFTLQGKLTIKSINFYGNSVGKRTYFDPHTGKVLKEEDQDKYFKFSVDDLAKKMKEEFNFDIMNKTETEDVIRLIDPNDKSKAFYAVGQKILIDNSVKAYLIEGNTGKLLYSLSYTIYDDEGTGYKSVYDEYLKTLQH